MADKNTTGESGGDAPKGGDRPAKGGDPAAKGGEKKPKGGDKSGGDAGTPEKAKGGGESGAPKGKKGDGGGDKKKSDKGAEKKAAPEAPEEPAPPPRLHFTYQSEIRGKLKEKFKLKNVHQVPRLKKITVNMGVGKAIENRKRLDAAMEDLAAITGQRARLCSASRSEANFKLRQGMPIGCKVDLRGARMYEFFDRLVSVAIPRIRDFRGINRNSFDGRGNFSMGLAEQIVFPEVPLDKVEFPQGMDITMVISGGSDEMSLNLLESLGMPFKRV